MSKIKIGDRVRVKNSGVIGTVVGREQKALDDKKVLVEYVVKTGDGFENYKPFARKDIEKVVNTEVKKDVKTYPRIYNYEHKCADGRTLVLTGVVDTFREEVTEREVYGETTLFETMKFKKKYLSIGYAICHPSDDNDKNVGAEIALGRAYSKPLAYFETSFIGEFREDFVTVVLAAKAKFVEENIDRFIERDKN